MAGLHGLDLSLGVEKCVKYVTVVLIPITDTIRGTNAAKSDTEAEKTRQKYPTQPLL